MNQLHDAGWNIIMATSRADDWRGESQRWLHRNGFQFDGYYNGDKTLLTPDVLIDDRPVTLEAMAAKGVTVLHPDHAYCTAAPGRMFHRWAAVPLILDEPKHGRVGDIDDDPLHIRSSCRNRPHNGRTELIYDITPITFNQLDLLSAGHPQGGFQQTGHMAHLATTDVDATDLIGVTRNGVLTAGCLIAWTRGRLGLEGSIWLGPLCALDDPKLLEHMTRGIRLARTTPSCRVRHMLAEHRIPKA